MIQADEVTDEAFNHFQMWWVNTDDALRELVLNPQAGAPLPGDLVLDMQFHNAPVSALGVVWSDEDQDRKCLCEQPEESEALLARSSEDHQ